MALTVLPPAGSGTDASSAPPALQSLLAQGTVRNAGQLYVQNQSANQIQLVLNYGGTQTVILIAAGGANTQGGDWAAVQNAPFFVGAFRIFGVANSQVGAIFN